MGINLSTAFPSNWLKASDVGGKDLTFTIHEVRMEKVGREKESKPVVYFDDGKPWILNRTNFRSIAKLYGENSDNWLGKPVTLYRTMAEMAGEPVEAIRVRTKKIEVEVNDSIPF